MFVKKTAIALLLAASFPVFADSLDFYVVVPVPGKTFSVDSIDVWLGGAWLPEGTPGVPYPDGVNLTNWLWVDGDPTFNGKGVTWEVVNGSLPPGLTLNKDGSITGTPTANGSSYFQVKATYKTKSSQRTYQIVVATIEVALAAGSPPQALVGQGYSYDLRQLLTVVDDYYYPPDVTWSVVSSSLPAGLYLTSDGFISGAPTEAGTGSITVRASYKGVNGDQTYQVVSIKISVSLAAAELPKAMVGAPYTYDLKPLVSVTGDPAYDSSQLDWVDSMYADVPAGLTLTSDGVITGTPAIVGPRKFTVRAAYRNGQGQQEYTIDVGGQRINVKSLVLGYGHACAITTSGGVKCWGANGYGVLGGGDSNSNAYMVDVVGLSSGVVALSAGYYHTCALTAGGGVKCWGYNGWGQLGDNSGNYYSSVPVDVVGLSSGITELATGEYHTCALTSGGGVKCWGGNDWGQSGSYNRNDRLVPVDVNGLYSGITHIAAGSSHTCALNSGGGLKCWGRNDNGQLGNGSTSGINTYPVDVYGLAGGVKTMTAGAFHTCAVTSAGGVKCWGLGSSGEMGDGNATMNNPYPVDVLGLNAEVVGLASGDRFTCARTTGGTVKCWGSNFAGQLGNGSFDDRSPVPVDVLALPAGVASLAANYLTTCVVLTDGNAKCWGNNMSKQFGNNSTMGSNTPVDVGVQDQR